MNPNPQQDRSDTGCTNHANRPPLLVVQANNHHLLADTLTICPKGPKVSLNTPTGSTGRPLSRPKNDCDSFTHSQQTGANQPANSPVKAEILSRNRAELLAGPCTRARKTTNKWVLLVGVMSRVFASVPLGSVDSTVILSTSVSVEVTWNLLVTGNLC